MIKKGQTGLDFLMTYGWALLIIVLVVGALFALGIFDIGSFLGSRASGFTSVGVSGWRLTEAGTLTFKLRNQAGTDINVTQINATLRTTSLTFNGTTFIANGRESSTLTITGFSSVPAKGSTYTIKLDLQYIDTNTGFLYGDSGTITGKVS